MALTPPLFSSPYSNVDVTKFGPTHWDRVVTLLNAFFDGADAKGALPYRDPTDVTKGMSFLPAVASGSVLVSGGVGAAPAWSASPSVTKILVGDGTSAAPAFAFALETGVGFYRSSAGQITVGNTNVSGGVPFNLGTAGFQLGSGMQLSWSNATSAISGGGDIALVRDAAGVLAQRVGATAQLLRIYNTFTDANNYERVEIGWNAGGLGANKFGILTASLGTGTPRALTIGALNASNFDIYTNGAFRWEVNFNGHLLAFTDSAFDIGASGANRPRNVYIGGNLTMSTGSTSLGWAISTATTSAGPATSGVWIPRFADLSSNLILDYQDEYAFIDGRGATVSTSPASTSGAGSDLFHDDSQSLNWTAGQTGGTIQITIDHTATAAVVPNRNNGNYSIGMTFRCDSTVPTHIKIEAWTTAAGGSFSTVYDQNVTIYGGTFGAWVSPSFASPDASFNMYKTRITMTVADPTVGNFRVQRVMLYHATAPWDTFHLGVGGGTLYGALNFAGTAGADVTLTRTAAGKLQLSGGSNPQLLFGGTTNSFPALKRTSANLEVRTADDGSYSGMIVDLLGFGPARGAIRQGGADGVFTLYNNALTDFGRLQFGGQSASFPSLKRDTVFLQLRLADDSGVCGAATASLPAAASARDGIIGFDTTLNALVYYVGGSRFKLTGTSF